jgi:ATP-dependent DNA helicase DinG
MSGGAPSLAGQAAEVFGPGGALARALPDYEVRTGQVEMAAAVGRAFEEGGVVLAEAGTGTGKTLAYLVPAVLSRQRVLISTGTKNLQEQVYFKDVPALRAALDIPFTAAYMKGRANYLCLHRLDRLQDGNGPASQDVFLPIIREWASRTDTGDRAELADLPEDLPFWNEVSATAEQCLGGECPRHDDCFVTRMRQRAAESDVVIVNHHLLCADAAVRQNAYGEVIPACSHAVLDEAHQLEDVVTQYFGFGVSNYRIEEIARDAERLLESALKDRPLAHGAVARAIEEIRETARTFFAELVRCHRSTATAPRGEERVLATDGSLREAREAAVSLVSALDLLASALGPQEGDKAADTGGSPLEDAEALVRRLTELCDEIRFLVRGADPEYVFFVELRGRGVFLRASPIDVSAIVRNVLLDRMRTTILTSATLTVDGTFEYIRTRLGIRTATELRQPSEFDFRRQAVLYLPARMPDPRSPDFPIAAGQQIVEILRRTRGRAFVLFTSYASLRVVQSIAEMALDYPILTQGTAPRSQLLAQFRTTPNAVLLATASFWQGVDVVGDALSCVIVDKLPFAPPDDPITAARMAAIQASGGEPFNQYQVPLAILALQQGLGRLIRHRTDRGVLAVLDPRLRTRGYGRRFLASLPPAPVVQDLGAIERFLQ